METRGDIPSKAVRLQLNGQLLEFFEQQQRSILQLTGKKVEIEKLVEQFIGDSIQRSQRFLSVLSSTSTENENQAPPEKLLPQNSGENHEPAFQPGLNCSADGMSFVPDFNELKRVGVDRSFYPLHALQQNVEHLENLYASPNFQRLSTFMEGRIVLISFVEGIDYRVFYSLFGLSDHQSLISLLCHFNKEMREPMMKMIIQKFGTKYGAQWIRGNRRPLGDGFLKLTEEQLTSTWWNYMGPIIEDNSNRELTADLPLETIKESLDLFVTSNEFKFLSQSIEGRLSLIAQAYDYSPERLAKELGIKTEELSSFAANTDSARITMLKYFGMSFGHAWVAYGIGVPDNDLIVPIILHCTKLCEGAKKFMRRVFKDVSFHRQNLGETINDISGNVKTCENCGKPIKGRRHMRFCPGGACQRAHHRKCQRKIDDDEYEVVSEDEVETTEAEVTGKKKNNRQDEKNAPAGNADWLIEKLSKAGDTFFENLSERAADQLGDSIFGQRKDNAANTNSNQTPKGPIRKANAEDLKRGEMPKGIRGVSPELHQFMGSLHFPFKMFVWGPPGHGKSSFCIKLAHALNDFVNCLYITQEEDPQGDTMREKIKLNCFGIPKNGKLEIISRLPHTDNEWKSTMEEKNEKNETIPKFEVLIYDSISKMKIGTNFLDTLNDKPVIGSYKDFLCHIFICHAEKDHLYYEGESGWEHEVDIAIKVFNGKAVITKNRFKTPHEGQVGEELNIFTTEFRAHLDEQALREKKEMELFRNRKDSDSKNETPPPAA